MRTITKAEAIDIINKVKYEYTFNCNKNSLKVIKAFNMAIEALTEPINCVKCKHYYETEEDSGIEGHCKMDTAHTDLISRADAIEAMKFEIIPYRRYHKGEWLLLLSKREVLDAIKALPSANAYREDCEAK